MVNNYLIYVIKEQKWTDLALGSLAPESSLNDQLNLTTF